MRNQEIAKIFRELADILEFRGENRYRVRAYRRGAQSLEEYPREVAELPDRELLQIPGVGQELARKIREFVASGTIASHLRMKEETPPGLAALLRVPGLGAKTALLLFETLEIADLDGLEKAAREHRLAGLPG
ncbi:MAG TPA: helix-hairpin-helix domain-containing protein, partial [Verrucomicrobiae bacterium]|nr:helix-hairpin-helix domain-containing protein [Verrucomicrobiae bacterium]